MDTDVSHEVEKRLTALEEFVGINKEEDESPEQIEVGGTVEEVEE